MTQEEKQLIFKDLCARLPYILMIQIEEHDWNNIHINTYDTLFRSYYIVPFIIGEIEIKPYLRPMSSMTEEENKQRKELGILLWYNSNGERGFDGFGEISGEDVLKAVDWLNAHHFDYRGLIQKGLALEAPEDMYKF